MVYTTNMQRRLDSPRKVRSSIKPVSVINFAKHVPALLVSLRIALGPTLLLLAMRGASGTWLFVTLLAALLSDILDGIIARRLGVATERLRVADSWADGWFYLCVCAAVWTKTSDIIVAFRTPIVALIAMDVFGYSIDLLKFRRITSLHAYSAKAWGLSLFAAAVALLVFHTGGGWLWLAIILGYTSNLDGLAIKLILTEWRTDVHSFYHAIKLRPGLLPQKGQK